MTGKNLQSLTIILRGSEKYSHEVIEATVIEYISKKTGIPFSYGGDMSVYEGKGNSDLITFFEEKDFPTDIEFIIEFFESLLETANVIENGIVFTPEYIAGYIFDQAVKRNMTSDTPRVIDPSCGCGIFLATTALRLHNNLGLSFADIFTKCIYGIELDPDNARRCKIVLNLLPLLYGESNKDIIVHILCADSLKTRWTELFGVESFDYIFGNPPYVNTHDMAKETARFLKQTFTTTKSGVYNIFYAFIEHAMQFLDADGVLSYIVPNNFLTIKSATDLRKLILDNSFLVMVLDFANNMVFKPVRTYNCIIQLDKKEKTEFNYYVMENVDDIENKLNCIEFEQMPLARLDVNGWKLIDRATFQNIRNIEGQFVSIKEFIRTGIATLRDEVYSVEKDAKGFYKIVDGRRFPIDSGIVKRFYKIPDLKTDSDLRKICRYIIFPYVAGKNGFEIMSEETLQTEYRETYDYLMAQKAILDGRDKGKPNPVAWYAYGRTQGLNKYGVKLLFPTFANRPRFVYVDDESALFCNGYAVFQNDFIDLDVLQRILNSKIMEYYIANTSYAIEGGYYCYQKKYIERFSVPCLSEEDIAFIRTASDDDLNDFLIGLYGLTLPLCDTE